MTLPPPPPAPGSETTRRPPWERRHEIGFGQGLLETIRLSLLQPVEFYRALDPHGPIAPALVFGVLVSWVGFTVGLLWDLVIPTPFEQVLGGPGAASGDVPVLVIGLAVWILVPLLMPFLLLLMAAVYHVVLLALGGPSRGYAATTRVLAYAAGPQLLSVVPFCGWFLGFVWATVLQVIGLREVHGIPTLKAVAVLVIPLLACAVLIGALFALVLWIAARGATGTL